MVDALPTCNSIKVARSWADNAPFLQDGRESIDVVSNVPMDPI